MAFLPWTMENEQRQLLAQSRGTSKSGISSGAFLVVLQKTMIYAIPLLVAGVSDFTYTHFSGGRGFAVYLHTFLGRFLSKIEKNDFKFETFSALRAPFFLSNP